MRIPYPEIAFSILLAVFFFRTARMERRPTPFWSGLSVLLSSFAFWRGWGWPGLIGVQVGLFAAMFLLNAIRARKRAVD